MLRLACISWAGLAKRKLILFFQHLSLRSSLTSASLLHFLVDWLISLAVTLVLKKRVNGRISAVLSPIWLKLWPKVGLASPLDCYSMKKSGCLLKKRSFRRFPSLVGTPFSSNASRSVGRISVVLSPIWLKFWPKVGLASLLDCYSLEKSGYLLKKRSFGRFPSLGGNRNKQGDLAILLIRIAKNKANTWQHG